MKQAVIVGLIGALVVALFVALSLGAVAISFENLRSQTLTCQQQAVLFSIRLPRMLLAVLVGAALAVSGASLQGLFRNPLADPGLMGVSSGAALAVALWIVLGGSFVGFLGIYGTSVVAFFGGLSTCGLILQFAKRASRSLGSLPVAYLLLGGIAINALAGAGTGFLSYLSDDQQLRTLTFWTMGSLGGAVWPSVLVMALVMVPVLIILIGQGKALNLILLGEEEAKHLGVRVNRVKNTVVICTALSVGAAVSVSGIIGFVGLVVPHLIRLVVGPDHRLLMPLSALGGALLLVLADTLARIVVIPAEMPVGILTSFIGGPFFLWLIVQQTKKRWVL